MGEATARHLADRGAIVVLGARRVDRLNTLVDEITKRGGKALALATDVTDAAQVQRLVDAAVERFGRIDVMLNNAGLMPHSPLDRRKIVDWDRTIDVNIKGVLYGIAAGLPIMKRQGYGQFVNISSIAAHYVMPTGAVYCATKYAVNALSEGLRQENKDIRVSIVSPGVTESELAQTITDESTRAMIEDYRKIALPAEAIAEAVAYAIGQPDDIDVNEIIVRPTASAR
jgi:NADP-dependent 3-hydroxy acid dehydrogenase YdfG